MKRSRRLIFTLLPLAALGATIATAQLLPGLKRDKKEKPTRSVKGQVMDEAEEGSLTFANFVEFDSLYGHRRDISGYARALEWFDREIGLMLQKLRPGDLMLLTADHGNDPSWIGTDHTREQVPVLIAGQGAGQIGQVDFADVAASIAHHLNIPAQGPGRNFL